MGIFELKNEESKQGSPLNSSIENNIKSQNKPTLQKERENRERE